MPTHPRQRVSSLNEAENIVLDRKTCELMECEIFCHQNSTDTEHLQNGQEPDEPLVIRS